MLTADPSTYARLFELDDVAQDRLLEHVHCRRWGQPVTTGATVADGEGEARAALVRLGLHVGRNRAAREGR